MEYQNLIKTLAQTDRIDSPQRMNPLCFALLMPSWQNVPLSSLKYKKIIIQLL